MPLNAQDKTRISLWVAEEFFGGGRKAVADKNLQQIFDAVTAVDNGFETTLQAAVAAIGGSVTVKAALSSVIDNAFTAPQKALVVVGVVRAYGGLL